MNIKSYSLYNFLSFFFQTMNNSRKKNTLQSQKKTGSDEIYTLLDEVESDLDEDVDNEMNDSDTIQIFWFLLPTFKVHHLEALPLIVQLVLKTSQPPGDGKD